ncbi:MAG: hypothetical protein U0457_12260 [Candidatus Sericytochromatia bacterium]
MKKEIIITLISLVNISYSNIFTNIDIKTKEITGKVEYNKNFRITSLGFKISHSVIGYFTAEEFYFKFYKISS